MGFPREFTRPPESKCWLHKWPLDRGGYDREGRYFGVGETVYRCECSETGVFEVYVRAPSRAAAYQKVCDRFPRYDIQLVKAAK